MANPPSAAELQSWHREAATSGKSELQAANALHVQWSPFKFLRLVYSQEGIPCGYDIEINSSIRPHEQISWIVHENATFSETLVSSLSTCVCVPSSTFVSLHPLVKIQPPDCTIQKLYAREPIMRPGFSIPSLALVPSALSPSYPRQSYQFFWLRSQTESTGSTKRCKQPSLTFPHCPPCGQYHC